MRVRDIGAVNFVKPFYSELDIIMTNVNNSYRYF